MSDAKYFLNVIRDVGQVGEYPISVGPDPDCPDDYVRVFTKNSEDEAYWGKIDFTMPKGMAVLLGQALISAGKDEQ